MNQGKYVFSQLISYASKYEFKKCVQRYNGDKRVRSFSCWNQFLCLSFGQLTHRESLRDIISCLEAQGKKLFNLGFRGSIARSTLSDANESRDWRIYADFAQILIGEARQLYANDPEFCLDLDNSVYALDATTVDLCLSVFKWAKFRKAKGAIKLHTLMDIRGSIPMFIHITNGKVHDSRILPMLEFEREAIYVMDRAYFDLNELSRLNSSGAYFVTRAQSNLRFRRQYSRPKPAVGKIVFDQIGVLTGPLSSKKYPDQLRLIKVKDLETGQTIRLITNHLTLKSEWIAELYRQRWQIELFFKWIKQHLRIKVFWGHSPNAVKIQVWIAVATYLLVAIVKERLQIKRSIYEILQILSVSIFDKSPLNELLMNKELHFENDVGSNQLNLFEL
jgi:hypothetical protein